MAWSYNPSDAVECLPEGDYDAELSAVKETTSKAGNPMLELTWTIMRDGRTFRVMDYIVQPSGLFRLKAIARALDRLDEFEAAEFDLTAHVRQVLRIYLTVQKSDQYPDRNQVTAYKATPADATPSRRVPTAAEDDSEVPF